MRLSKMKLRLRKQAPFARAYHDLGGAAPDALQPGASPKPRRRRKPSTRERMANASRKRNRR